MKKKLKNKIYIYVGDSFQINRGERGNTGRERDYFEMNLPYMYVKIILVA
jgi:hypothetical protein